MKSKLLSNQYGFSHALLIVLGTVIFVLVGFLVKFSINSSSKTRVQEGTTLQNPITVGETKDTNYEQLQDTGANQQKATEVDELDQIIEELDVEGNLEMDFSDLE